MRSVKFELPYPVSLNQLYRIAGNKLVLSARAQRYKTECAISLYEQKLQQLKIDCHVAVEVEAYPKSNRKSDVDNLLKLPFDVLTQNDIWVDDSLVKKLTITKHDKDAANPRLELTITELNLKQKDI